MEDAGFILTAYAVTFGGDRRLRRLRHPPRPPGDAELPDEVKPWT